MQLVQANRPHMLYNQFVDHLSSVTTRSLQNHQLLCIKTVTYQLETSEPAAQLCFQWMTGGHKSHGLGI